MKHWLPQLIVANVALAAAIAGGIFLTLDESQQIDLVGDWANAGENETVQLRLPVIVWATILFASLGGFYLAAAMAGFVNSRDEP